MWMSDYMCNRALFLSNISFHCMGVCLFLYRTTWTACRYFRTAFIYLLDTINSVYCPDIITLDHVYGDVTSHCKNNYYSLSLTLTWNVAIAFGSQNNSELLQSNFSWGLPSMFQIPFKANSQAQNFLTGSNVTDNINWSFFLVLIITKNLAAPI